MEQNNDNTAPEQLLGLYNQCPKHVFATIVITLLDKEYFPCDPGLTKEDYERWLGVCILKHWFRLHVGAGIKEAPPASLWVQFGEKPPK